MLISKTADVQLNSQNMDYYKNLGYYIPYYKYKNGRFVVKRGTTINIRIEDLPLNSHSQIIYRCDYCGKDHPADYSAYNNNKKKTIIKKDACSKCRTLKAKEVNLLKYGVENLMQIKSVAESVGSKTKHSYEFIYNDLKSVGYTLITKQYKNNRQKLEYICDLHPNYGVQTITYRDFSQIRRGCDVCAKERVRESFVREEWYNWKGGVTSLFRYLKVKIKQWKEDSMKNCDYKCIFTDSKDFAIHHLYGFNMILHDAISNLSLTIKDKIGDYTQQELQEIEKEVMRLHYIHPLGICLRKDIHNLFHSLYGQGNNTPDQFYEFKKRYESGEFKDILQKVS